ncbi:hypothetical protein C8R46DRAFT_1070990 [Mycena filopes]|nr:hypothetical protein C8R46DRAFT_1070990 [Mycena filopes]
MPKAITLAASVAKSILEVIASLAYTPGSLPFVHPLAWPRCFNEPLESASKEEHATAANERATYKQLGCSTIEQIVFLLLLPNLAGKPPGFVKSIQNAVFADGVINTLSSKINDSLLTDIGTRRVDDGFCAFVGVRWALAEYDTGLVKQLLSPILSPIVEVGSKACMFPKRHPRARLGRYPADPQYILNIKTVLDSEDDTPLADESSGVPWPLPVFPPPTPAPTLSPTAFRPHTPAYNPGPILTQDLHPRRTRTKRYRPSLRVQ